MIEATGVAVLLLGLVIRSMAIKENPNFTWHKKSPLSEIPTHIVTTGIYRYIRHPGYLGSMMIAVGLSLISLHLALWLIVWSFLMDKAIEEERVIEGAGFPYACYRLRTGMFIPKFLRRRPEHVQARGIGTLHPSDEVM